MHRHTTAGEPRLHFQHMNRVLQRFGSTSFKHFAILVMVARLDNCPECRRNEREPGVSEITAGHCLKRAEAIHGQCNGLPGHVQGPPQAAAIGHSCTDHPFVVAVNRRSSMQASQEPAAQNRRSCAQLRQ
eukprot:scaffold6194_cov131-Isochrysis_galbana.AAC.1